MFFIACSSVLNLCSVKSQTVGSLSAKSGEACPKMLMMPEVPYFHILFLNLWLYRESFIGSLSPKMGKRTTLKCQCVFSLFFIAFLLCFSYLVLNYGEVCRLKIIVCLSKRVSVCSVCYSWLACSGAINRGFYCCHKRCIVSLFLPLHLDDVIMGQE